MFSRLLSRLLVVLALSAPLVPAVVTTQAVVGASSASATTCLPRSVSKTTRVDVYNDLWVDVTNVINFNECHYSGGLIRSDPINWKPSYNLQGSSYSCGGIGFNGVKLDLYLKDGTGANYHPSRVTLPCSSSTQASDVISLSSSPELRNCFGPPQWKVNFTVVRDLDHDIDRTQTGVVWQHIGPVPNDC